MPPRSVIVQCTVELNSALLLSVILIDANAVVNVIQSFSGSSAAGNLKSAGTESLIQSGPAYSLIGEPDPNTDAGK